MTMQYIVQNENDYFSQSGLATLELDEALTIVRFNDELSRITGIPEPVLSGMKWNDLVAYYNPCSNSGENLYMKWGMKTPTGKFWCWQKYKKPRRIFSATVRYDWIQRIYYATLYDISDQISPEKLVSDGGIITGVITDSVKGAMGYHDGEGIIRFASREICTMAGLNSRDIIGRHISDFFDHELVEKWLSLMNRKNCEIPGNLEFNTSGSRNHAKLFHLIATPRLFMKRDGSVAGCMFIFADITELKHHEKKLKISDEKYSKAFHASPAPSSITTLKDGRFIEVNESYTKLVGYSKEELIGETTTSINFIINREEREKFIKELMVNGKLRDYETQVYSRVKGVRTFSLSAEIIELQGEKCIILVGYDVTDQIRLEKEVLTITGRERYKIGQYLHDDLGQHIVGIEAMCAILESRMKAHNSPDVDMLTDICEYLREAHEKARNMAGGLCPVRLEENGLSCAIEELSLNISRMYNIKCEYRNYNSNIKIYNSQIAINMYYIVREAVNNAVKHGKAGDIEITYSSNADTIFLLIKDDGEGFDTARNESPGMGLSLIKYRARAIGGSVEIKSGPGSGTSVLLKLPRINNKKNEWDWKQKTYEEITSIYSR